MDEDKGSILAVHRQIADGTLGGRLDNVKRQAAGTYVLVGGVWVKQ